MVPQRVRVPRIKRYNEMLKVLWQGDFTAAERLLAEHPWLLHYRNGVEETALHYCALEGWLEAVAWLHAHGAPLDVVDIEAPALFYAARMGHRELLLWFRDHGADFSVRDRDGLTLIGHLRFWQPYADPEGDYDDMVAFIRANRMVKRKPPRGQ